MSKRRVLIPLSLSREATLRPYPAEGVEELRGKSMGTSWSVKLVRPAGGRLEAIERGICSELERIIAQMSTWETDSDISRFNRAPASTWHDLPHDFYTVLDYALSLADSSAGAYDPTAGALVDLWGFGPRDSGIQMPKLAPPEDLRIEAMARCGWRLLTLERDARRVWQPGGVRLDFSSVAKGYAVDCVVEYLARVGVEHCLVEIGGELRGRGVKPGGLPWWVAFERPGMIANSSVETSETIIALHGLSIATSGDYRRYYEVADRRYSHTIDPRQGCPVTNSLASVTVIEPSCMRADAMSTALTVMGLSAGLHYANERGIAALFVSRTQSGDLDEHMSIALARMLD